VLHAHNLVPPTAKPYGQEWQSWWEALEIPLVERLRVQHDLAILHQMDTLLAAVEKELYRLSGQSPWAEDMTFLMQLPGFGLVNSMTLLAAIGDISRFPTAAKLVGYSGLGASVHASGQTYQTGKITKQGRREMRTALIEAAWIAVQRHPLWKERFARLSKKIGPGKAIVAIAR
jgi:transposase